MNKQNEAGKLPVIQHASSYESFVSLNKAAIERILQQIAIAVPNEQAQYAKLEDLHWDLIDDMKGHLASAAANETADDARDQESALERAEDWVSSHLSGGGTEATVAMAFLLKGETTGLKFLQDSLGIPTLSLSDGPEGKVPQQHMTVYQPDADHMPDDLMSFEVFQSLEAGKSRYPEVPSEAWLTLNLGDVEDASILDAEQAGMKLQETMSQAKNEVSAQAPFEVPAINNQKLALMRYLNLNGDNDADYDKVKELGSVSAGVSGAYAMSVFEYDNATYHVAHASAGLEAAVLQEFNSNFWGIRKVEGAERANLPGTQPSEVADALAILVQATEDLQKQLRAHHKMNAKKDYSLMVADAYATKVILKAKTVLAAVSAPAQSPSPDM
ncbi:hypothetical protein [Paraburkholderia youngii]|uniref:hypothetical protein n=1 Tax=Paraburkholderia youngii TaxID=2782701 RepID=UPI003D263067